MAIVSRLWPRASVRPASVILQRIVCPPDLFRFTTVPAPHRRMRGSWITRALGSSILATCQAHGIALDLYQHQIIDAPAYEIALRRLATIIVCTALLSARPDHPGCLGSGSRIMLLAPHLAGLPSFAAGVIGSPCCSVPVPIDLVAALVAISSLLIDPRRASSCDGRIANAPRPYPRLASFHRRRADEPSALVVPWSGLDVTHHAANSRCRPAQEPVCLAAHAVSQASPHWCGERQWTLSRRRCRSVSPAAGPPGAG